GLRYAPREDYTDPRHVGRLVLEDFTRVIDELYPLGAAPEPLDREAAEHEAFAASRCEVYVAREADLARLDAHADGDGLPLVVLGEPGSGKSALLANWARRYRERSHAAFASAAPRGFLARWFSSKSSRKHDTLVLMHFIGATSHSTHWVDVVLRLLVEFRRHLDLKLEIPVNPEQITGELRLAFAHA